MKRASRGTVDESDAMQKAVKGMVSGMSGEQIISIMEAARVAARIAGEDVKTAYENITDAISTGLPKGLRKYLLITKEEMALVKEALKAGVEDVDLFTLAMANAQIQQAKFGELSENAAESVQRHRAEIQDLTEQIGIHFVTAVGNAIAAHKKWTGLLSGGSFWQTVINNIRGVGKAIEDTANYEAGVTQEQTDAYKAAQIERAEADKRPLKQPPSYSMVRSSLSATS